MALGGPAIERARESMRVIEQNLESASISNDDFKKLFNDPNFQKFVKDTNRGKTLNEQLNSLSNWMTSMEQVVESLDEKTNRYLATQDSINE